MELVALVGSDKETWGQISGLINHGEWEKVILVQNKSAQFPAPENANVITIDSSLSLLDLKQKIQEQLKKLLGMEFEVALSIASGSGKEHMALISALLNIPVGIKLAVFTKNGIEFLT